MGSRSSSHAVRVPLHQSSARDEAETAFAAAVREQLAGATEAARAGYERALAIDPAMAEAHNNLGVLLRWQDVEAARAAFSRASRLRPGYAEAHNNLGLLLQQTGALADAIAEFRAAVAADAGSVDAHNNLGLALRESGDPLSALGPLRAALRLAPNRPESHNNLGNALIALTRLDDAGACYRRALELAPDYPEALNNLGATLRAERRTDEAIPLLRRALTLRPGYLDALNNLALCLPEVGAPEEILALLNSAVAAAPEAAAPRATLAVGLAELGRHAEARQSAESALAIDARCVDAWNVLGMCAFEERDLDGMRRCYERALTIDPRSAIARWNRGLALLAMGQWTEGWADYEARWELVNMMRDRRHFDQPAWDGSPLAGRTILLYTEQGFGDSIQFVRHARTLREQWGARVVLECDAALAGLLRTLPWLDEVVVRGAALPPFDVHAPLLALPHRLGLTVDALDGAAYLEAQPRPIARRVVADGALRVGIVWQGRAPNPNLARRSLPLESLAPLAAVPGVRLFSLQVGDGAAQLRAVPFGDQVENLAPDLGDFTDTAAAMRELDLVVTIDSAVAHLAGALGVPVWVMLMRSADWRWLLDRDDSPFYDSARLFRQRVQDDWQPVIADVTEALRTMVGAGRPSPAGEAQADDAGTTAELPSQQCAADGAPRFVLSLPYTMLATEPGFAAFSAELTGEGVDVATRLFLDDQLRDGDVVVDIDAGWGFAALSAATSPGAAAHVVAVVADAAEAAVLRAAAASARLTGTMDIRQPRSFDDVSVDALADASGDRRVFLRVGDAAALSDALAGAHRLIATDRLAAVVWTPRRAGAAAAVDAMMLEGLEAFGFRHFAMRRDDDGVLLDPWHSDDDEGTVFSLSATYLAAANAVAASDKYDGAADDDAAAAAAVVGHIGTAPSAPSLAPSLALPSAPASPLVRLGIDWQVGTSSGWGVYGLNLVRYCLRHGTRDGAPQPVLLTAPDLRALPDDVLHELAPVVENHAALAAMATAHGGAALAADFPVLRALGNGVHGNPGGVQLVSQRDVGVIFFEDTALDAAAIARGRRHAGLVAGSTWNAEVLRGHGLSRVVTVLQGVDSGIFHPLPRGERTDERFVVFSGGKLEYRKGQDIVVAAFREFRRHHPEAVLMVAWHNHWPQTMAEIPLAGHVRGVPSVGGDGRMDVVGWLASNGVPAESVVDVGLRTNAEMGALIRGVDLALFPNRAEGGTNLVAMECLASGVPTILSANTGHLDLVDDARCYALRAQAPASPSPSFRGTDGWGESSVDEIIACMEQAWSDRADAASRGAAAAAWMRDLSWDNQIARLLDQVRDLT